MILKDALNYSVHRRVTVVMPPASWGLRTALAENIQDYKAIVVTDTQSLFVPDGEVAQLMEYLPSVHKALMFPPQNLGNCMQ